MKKKYWLYIILILIILVAGFFILRTRYYLPRNIENYLHLIPGHIGGGSSNDELIPYIQKYFFYSDNRLIDIATDKSQDLINRKAAMIVLREREPIAKKALDPLLSLLEDKTEDLLLRSSAAQSVSMISVDPVTGVVWSKKSTLPLLKALDETSSQEFKTKELDETSKEYTFHISLVHSLGVLKDVRATQALIEQTYNKELEMLHWVAIDALGFEGNINATDRLTEILLDSTYRSNVARTKAANSLCSIKTPKIINSLTQILSSQEIDDVEISKEIITCLGNSNDKNAIKPLILEMERKDSDARIIMDVASALAKLDAKEAIPNLEQTFELAKSCVYKNNSYDVANAVCYALDDLKGIPHSESTCRPEVDKIYKKCK